MTEQGIFVLAVLCANIFLSEVLVRKTRLRILGSALIVILLTAITANAGIIPTSSEEAPIYDGIFSYVAPMAVFLLLLSVNLKDVLKAGLPLISMFLIGSAGTIAGMVTAMWLMNGPEAIGESYRGLAGAFTGTYIGGSVNFNAIALHYGIMKQGTLFAGAVAVDNIITTLWMLVCLAFPKLTRRTQNAGMEAVASADPNPTHEDTDVIHALDLAILLASGSISIAISNYLASIWKLPSILILTTIALILAQLPTVRKLRGNRVLGMFGLLLFLAVIGAFCDLRALTQIGKLGVSLLALAAITVIVHGLILFFAGLLFKIDPIVNVVASQANIGGPASALAVARSLGRTDLILPAILVGMLGYALGNYAGFFVAEVLLP